MLRNYRLASILLLLSACSGEEENTKKDGENIAPQAMINALPVTGVPPLSVYFDATGSSDEDGQIVRFDWDFGDGTTGSGFEQEHTYRRSGTYSVKLKVTDDMGGLGEATISVTATRTPTAIAPMAAFTISEMRGPAPLTINLDASTSTDSDGIIVLHAWDLGDDSKASGQQLRHTYRDVGVYEITLTVYDDDGIEAEAMASIRVTEEGGGIPPEASFTLSKANGFAPLTVDFDGTASEAKEGTLTSFVWAFGDGQMGNGSMLSHTYASAGVYRPQLTVSNDANLSHSTDQRIVVRGSSPLPFADDFSEDRGWIVVDEGDAFAPSNWRLINGRLVQGSNIGGGGDDAGSIEKPGTHVYYGDSNWTNYDVAVVFNSADNDSVGIIARYIDDDNFYRFSVDTQRGFIRIVAKDAGDYYLVAEELNHPGYSANTDHTLKLSVNGSIIEAYLDDSLVLTATDTRHNSGAVGLYSWYSENVRFDDLSVSAQ